MQQFAHDGNILAYKNPYKIHLLITETLLIKESCNLIAWQPYLTNPIKREFCFLPYLDPILHIKTPHNLNMNSIDIRNQRVL